MQIFGVEIIHIIIGLCSVYLIGYALLFAWWIAIAPYAPPWKDE